MQLRFWKIIDVLKKLLHDSSFMVWKSWIHVFIILKMIFQASGHDNKKESKQEVHINSSDFLYIKKWICESSLLPAWQKHNFSLSYHDLSLYEFTSMYKEMIALFPRFKMRYASKWLHKWRFIWLCILQFTEYSCWDTRMLHICSTDCAGIRFNFMNRQRFRYLLFTAQLSWIAIYRNLAWFILSGSRYAIGHG